MTFATLKQLLPDHGQGLAGITMPADCFAVKDEAISMNLASVFPPWSLQEANLRELRRTPL
jgi:hypothetical protein